MALRVITGVVTEWVLEDYGGATQWRAVFEDGDIVDLLRSELAGVRALRRQHYAPIADATDHDAALAATARWCASRNVYRMLSRAPLRCTVVGVCPTARPILFPLLDRGADAAADAVHPAVVDARRRVEKLTVVLELRHARHAVNTPELDMVPDATATLRALKARHSPHASTDPEYSSSEEPSADAPVASGTFFALLKDDPSAREERARRGEPLRVRPLGVGSVLVRLASTQL
eukprot:jgi/Tetstr1/437152/TSEL_025912.t1